MIIDNVDTVFGPNSNTDEVYDIAARPVVKAAMEGINGMTIPNFMIWCWDRVIPHRQIGVHPFLSYWRPSSHCHMILGWYISPWFMKCVHLVSLR